MLQGLLLSRRRQFYLIAFACLALILTWLNPDVKGAVVLLKTSHPAITQLSFPLPTLDDLEAGTWTPRHQPLDLDLLWSGEYSMVEGVGPEAQELQGGELERARKERATRIASWAWTGPGAVADLDVGGMLTRALRSPGGIILVGGKSSPFKMLVEPEHEFR
jgi:hypothetical protein